MWGRQKEEAGEREGEGEVKEEEVEEVEEEEEKEEERKKKKAEGEGGVGGERRKERQVILSDRRKSNAEGREQKRTEML